MNIYDLDKRQRIRNTMDNQTRINMANSRILSSAVSRYAHTPFEDVNTTQTEFNDYDIEEFTNPEIEQNAKLLELDQDTSAGSFSDSYNLLQEKRLQSDLNAALNDAIDIENQKKDVLLANDYINAVKKFNDLQNELSTANPEKRTQIAKQLVETQNEINEYENYIKTTGKRSEILRNLFFDTNKELTVDGWKDLLIHNTIVDREAQRNYDSAIDQLKNSFNQDGFLNKMSSFAGGAGKAVWSGVEGVFGVAANALKLANDGINAVLPEWMGGTKEDYSNVVHRSIRESDINNRSYDSLFVSGQEILNDPTRSKKFANAIAENNNWLSDRQTDINLKINDIRNKLTEGTWYFNPNAIDPDFRRMQESIDTGLLGMITHPLYSFPELGSSLSDLEHFALLTGIDTAAGVITSDMLIDWLSKKAATKAIGGTYAAVLLGAASLLKNPTTKYALASAETVANVALTEKLRENETKQEVFDAYTNRVINELYNSNVDINALLEAIDTRTQEIGLPQQTDPIEKLKLGLTLNVGFNDPEYNKIITDARKGLAKVYNENQTLMAKDILEGLVVMDVAGKAFKSAFFRSNNPIKDQALTKLNGIKTTELLRPLIENGKATVAQRAEYWSNKQIDNLFYAFAKSPMAKVKRDRVGKFIKDKLKKIAGIAPLEGLEEGQQNLLQKRYEAGEYDDYQAAQSAFNINSLFQDLYLGEEALAMYLGSYFGDPTEAELEHRRAMNIGFTTSLWFGVPHHIVSEIAGNENSVRNLAAQLKTDNNIRRFVADNYARVQDDAHVGKYFDMFHKIGINSQRVAESLNSMKQYKGELVTDEYIDQDIQLAHETYALYKSSVLNDYRNKKGYKKGSTEFRELVKDAVQTIRDYETIRDRVNTRQEDIKKQRDDLRAEIQNLTLSKISKDPQDDSKDVVTNAGEYKLFLEKVLKEYQRERSMYSETRKNWQTDPTLRLEAKKRLMDRGYTEEEAETNALEEVRKYVFDQYSESERKAGAEGLQPKTFDLYVDDKVDYLIAIKKHKLFKSLIDQLKNRKQLLSLVQSETGTDVNTEGLISLIDQLLSVYDKMDNAIKGDINSRNNVISKYNNVILPVINKLRKAQGKTAEEKRKRIIRDTDLEEYGYFGNINDILRNLLVNDVNIALLNVMAPRVQAYTTGKADPIQLANSLRMRKWSELSESQKDQYRKKAKDDAQKAGKSEPSERSIISKFNFEQQEKRKKFNELSSQYKKKLTEKDTLSEQEQKLDEATKADFDFLEKTAAEEFIDNRLLERIKNREERNKIYHSQRNEQVGRIVDDGSFHIEDTDIDESQISTDIPQTSLNVEQDDIETTPQMPTDDRNTSDMTDEMKLFLGLDSQGATSAEMEAARILGEQPAALLPTVPKDEVREILAEDSEKNVEHIKPGKNPVPDFPKTDDAEENNSDDEDDNENDGVENTEGSESLDDGADVSGEEQSSESLETGQNNPDIQGDSQLDLNEDEDDSVITENEDQEDTPTSTEMPDDGLDLGSLDHPIYNSDDTSYNSADYQSGDDEISGNRKAKVNKKDVLSGDEAYSDYLSSTFFYQPNSTTPLYIGVSNGEEAVTKLDTTYDLQPGKELAKKLLDKKWITSCECYYVCSGNLSKKGRKNKDAVTIMLIIDDHNEKKTYACALSTPGRYSYGERLGNEFDGENDIVSRMEIIGLDEEYVVGGRGKRRHIDYNVRNQFFELMMCRAYEQDTHNPQPIPTQFESGAYEVAWNKYVEKAKQWYTSQNQAVHNKIMDDARRMMSAPNKRIITSDEIRQQIQNLKAVRNAIIDAYCNIDLEGNITIPTRIKKNIIPETISISNGRFNNVRDEDGAPVWRNLTECKLLQIPNDPELITEMINNGQLLFGFGRGKRSNMPYAISNVTNETVNFDTRGEAGKSGSIYIMVDDGNGKLVPVMLKAGRFSTQENESGNAFINRGYEGSLILCIDPVTGEINHDNKGTKPSLAELILYMVCGKLNVNELPVGIKNQKTILDLIINNGENTILDPDSRTQNDIPQLADKQIAVVEVNTKLGPKRKLILGGIDENEERYQKVIDIDELFDPEDDSKRISAIFDIKERLHWNTEVKKDAESKRGSSMTDEFPIELILSLRYYFEENPDATEYKMFGLSELTFKKEDFFESNGDVLSPKNCNILSWLITSGHMLTDLGDTVFADPFVFASGTKTNNQYNVQEQIIKQGGEQIPGGTSVVPIAATRYNQKKILDLSKVPGYRKGNVQEMVASTDQAREEYLSKTDGLYDKIALAVDFAVKKGAPLAQNAQAYREALEKSVNEYVQYVKTKEGFTVSEVKYPTIDNAALQNTQAKNYVPVLQVYKDGTAKVLIVASSSLLGRGVQTTGVFSKVELGLPLTDEECRQFFKETLGVEEENLLILKRVYDAFTHEEVFGVVDVAFDILSGNKKGIITISSANNHAATFHEAFHYVNLLLHSKKERDALYDAFVKTRREDLKNATRKEIEEALAEDFREYMEKKVIEQRDTTIYGKIKKFFNTIWNFMNVFKKKDLVYLTYEAIRKGGYKNKAIDEDSINAFKAVYPSGAKLFNIPGLKHDASKNFKAITDYQTYYRVAYSLANRFLDQYSVKKPEDLDQLKENGGVYKEFIESLYEEFRGSDDTYKREIVLDVFNNPAPFKSSIIRALSDHGIKLSFSKQKDLEVNNTKPSELADKPTKRDTGDRTDNTWDIENYLLSKKDNVAFRAKLFLGLILVKRFEPNFETWEKEAVTQVDSVLGFPIYYPFSEAWNKILDELWGVESYDELDPNSKDPKNPYKKDSLRYMVRHKAQTEEFYAALDEKLDQCVLFDGTPDIQLLNLILSTIKSSKPVIAYSKVSTPVGTQIRYGGSDIQEFEGEELNTSSRLPSDTEKDFTLFTDNTFKAKRTLPRDWSKNAIHLGLATYVTKNGETQFVLNKDYIEALKKEYDVILNLMFDEQMKGKNQSKIVKKQIPANTAEEIYETTLDAFVTLLQHMGITADRSAVEHLILSENPQGLNDYQVRCASLLNLLENKTGSIRYFIYNIMMPNAGKTEIRRRNINDSGKALGRGNATPIEQIYYGYRDNTFITKYAVAYSSVHPTSSDFSVTSPDGKQIYPISDNNFISDRVRRIINNDQELVDVLMKTPYAKRSIIINDIGQYIKRHSSGEVVNKDDLMQLVAIVGIKDADKNDGADYFGMTRMEDYLTKMVATFGEIKEEKIGDDFTYRLINRLLTLPTMADKKTYYAIRHKLFDSLFADDLVTQQTQSENGVANIKRFSDSTLRRFYNYFLDELDTVEQYYDAENIRHKLNNKNKRRKNYHGKFKKQSDGSVRMDLSGNGGMFRHCYDFIIDPETGLNINQMIEAKWKAQRLIEETSGKQEFRDKDSEYDTDGFELVRQYLSELRLKYGRFDDAKDGINDCLIGRVDGELEAMWMSNDMLLITKQDDGVYAPRKIPFKILQYYESRIANSVGVTSKQRGYTSIYKNDAAYSAIANHTINTMISLIEYEKAFTGDIALFKWKYLSDKNNITTTVNDVEVSVRKLRDISTDYIKRLGAGLSPGKNVRSQYSLEIIDQYPELGVSKYTNCYIQDVNYISAYLKDVERFFTSDGITECVRYQKEADLLWFDDFMKEVGQTNKEFVYNAIYLNQKIETGKYAGETYFEVVNKYVPKDVKTQIKDDVARQMHPYSEVNVADALVFIRPDMYRKIRIGLGEWDFETDEVAFELLQKDDSWMYDQEKAEIVKHLLLYPLKMTYFDNAVENDFGDNTISVSRYNKMCIFPMFKYMATSETGILLYDRMNREGNELDMVTFDSAVKVGGIQNEGSLHIKDADGFSNINEVDDSFLNDSDQYVDNTGLVKTRTPEEGKSNLAVLIQDISRLLMLLNTEAHTDEERAIGTQMFKIAFSDIIDNAMYGINKLDKKSRRGREIKREIMACINALTERGRTDIINDYLQRPEQAVSLIKKVIETNDLGSFDKQLIENHYTIASSSSRRVYEQSVSSKVNSKVVEIHTKGGSAIQQSSIGFAGYGNRSVESYTGQYHVFNGGRSLKWVKKNGSMEVMLSMNFFKAVVPKNEQTSYKSMRDWLIEHDIIKGIKKDGSKSNPKPFGVGYRIPTQGMSSMFTFTVADVLPEQSGDLIIVPPEFTAQTGSDFDVDKLFLATMSYKDGVLEKSDVFDKSIEDKSNLLKVLKGNEEVSDGAIQNRLLENYIDIISDTRNFALSRASIDVFTGIIQDEILPELSEVYNIYKQGLSECTPMYQSLRKLEFSTGKFGIAPFALNITNHALTQYADLCMYYGENPYELGKLNAIVGEDGKHILGWLSAMVNAHVDVAKDPYVFTLNVNKVTYNMTNFLIRSGKGASTFSFIAQPILKEYANQLNSSGGFFGNEDGKEQNTEFFQSDKEKARRKLYTKYYNRMISAFNAQKAKLSEKERIDWETAISKIKLAKSGYVEIKSKITTTPEMLYGKNVPEEFNSKEHRKQLAEKSGLNIVFNKDFMLLCAKKQHLGYFKAAYAQLLTLYAFDHLEKYADEMSALVMNSRIDTKKFGNNRASLLNFENNYEQFKWNTNSKKAVYWYIDKKGETEELFKARIHLIKETKDRSAVRQYFESTFLDYKFQQAKSLGRRILYHQAFTSSKVYGEVFKNVMGSLFGIEVINDDHTSVGYRSQHNDNTILQVSQAIESIFRTRSLQNTEHHYAPEGENDYVGKIDFAFNGDINAAFEFVNRLINGDPNKTGRDSNSIMVNFTNFMSVLENRPEYLTEEEWWNIRQGLVDENGTITNDLLNLLKPIPPSKNFPQGRFLLKESLYNIAADRKDVLISAFDALLSHPHKSVRRLARELAIYAYYSDYGQSSRDSFFDLVPLYYRSQYDQAIKDGLYNENNTRLNMGIIEDSNLGTTNINNLMDDIARNFWFNSEIVPRKIESKTIGRFLESYDIKDEMGLVPILYRVNSKRRQRLYGAIVTKDDRGDYFTIKHDDDVFLYKKIGTVIKGSVVANEERLTTHNMAYPVYFIIPKLGKHSGNKHSYELMQTRQQSSMYTDNVLPETFMYDNILSEVVNWVVKHKKPYVSGSQKTKDGGVILAKTAEFRIKQDGNIQGLWSEVNQQTVSFDRFYNADGDVRMVFDKQPVQRVYKESTMVLNFGVSDENINGAIENIDVDANDSLKTVSKKIKSFMKQYSIGKEQPIVIGCIGNNFNVSVTKSEIDAFVKSQVDDYVARNSQHVEQDETAINPLDDNQIKLIENYAKSAANDVIKQNKITDMFNEIFSDLIAEGYPIQTVYSTGNNGVERAFINAGRLSKDLFSIQLMYIAVPESYKKVDNESKYQEILQMYDQQSYYVINDNERADMQNVEIGNEITSGENITDEFQSQNNDELDSPETSDTLEQTPESKELDDSDFNTETTISAKDLFESLGLDITQLKKETEPFDDSDLSSESQTRCISND